MASQGTERRLAAIMFTDIVGYTALMAQDEAKGLRVRERHRELVRPQCVDLERIDPVLGPGAVSLLLRDVG